MDHLRGRGPTALGIGRQYHCSSRTEGYYIRETDIAEAPSRASGCFAQATGAAYRSCGKADPDQLFQGFFGGISLTP